MEISTEDEKMTAKEYVTIATKEYLSGMSVIAENISKDEEFGLIEAIVPIRDTHVLKLTVEYIELTEGEQDAVKKEREEAKRASQESAEEELSEFGIGPWANEALQSKNSKI